MAGKQGRNAGDEVLVSLQIWARQNGRSTDPYVMGLTNALERKNKKNLSFWASLNPNEFLPYSSFVSSRRKSRSALVLIRNTLIFVPVAITWLAIGKSTSAFQTYIKQNSGGVTNFLDFWQNGYGILNNFWKIAHIAALDAIILSLIIGLTVFIHFLDESISREEKKKKLDLESGRLRIVIQLAEFLFSKRTISDITMKDALANATNDLLQASRNIDKSSKDLKLLTKTSSISRIDKAIRQSLNINSINLQEPTRGNFDN